jgi:hypothetical protein
MFQLPSSTLTHLFSCHFLWVSLSLSLYLNEKDVKGNIGLLSTKWGKQSDLLAHWTIEEGYFILGRVPISQVDKDTITSIAGELGDVFMLHLADILSKSASSLYAKKIPLEESIWCYYYYCQFLWQVLQEFDQIMQELGVSSIYYQRYQASIDLFHDMAGAMERERPFLDKPGNVDEATIQAVWAEIEATAARLGTEWRQAVLEAAHHQRLPDFISPE